MKTGDQKGTQHKNRGMRSWEWQAYIQQSPLGPLKTQRPHSTLSCHLCLPLVQSSLLKFAIFSLHLVLSACASYHPLRQFECYELTECVQAAARAVH